MFMTQQLRPQLQSLIKNHRIQDIDLTDKNVANALLQFVHELKPSVESLLYLKILIISYGLPIIIMARAFYQRACSDCQFIIANKTVFIKLAALTIEWIGDLRIQEIDFMFRFGRPIQNPKPIQKTAAELLFISLVQDLDQAKSAFKNCTTRELSLEASSYYRNLVFKIKSDDFAKLDALMQGCIENLQSQHFPDTIQIIQVSQEEQPISSQDQSLIGIIELLSESSQHLQQPEHSTATPLKDSSLNNHQTLSIQLTLNTSSPKDNPSNLGKNEDKKFLCCRSFFMVSESVVKCQDENQSTQFLYAPYPFKKQKEESMKKIICSFLNHDGGNLFIGLANSNGSWRALGISLYDNEKEEVLRFFRKICSSIQPDILAYQMYHIEFIPLCLNANPIQRLFVIKVVVKYGMRDEIYSYKQKNVDHFPFRDGIQIVEKQGRQLFKQLNRRLQNPRPIPQPLHPEPCHKPGSGWPFKKSMQELRKNHLATSPFHSSQIQQKSIAVERYHTQCMSSTQDLKLNAKQFIVRPFVIQEEESTLGKPEISRKNSGGPQKEMKIGGKKGYFYCPSLTSKQLIPLFQRKGLDSRIKIQEISVGVVLKIEEDAIIKVRKVFFKLEQKYSDRQIKFYEISLKIKVQKISEARKLIQDIGLSKFEIEPKLSTLIFRKLKDSLQVFIKCKEAGIWCEFIDQDP